MLQSVQRLWAYIKQPLVNSKSKSSADEQTVKALNFMASSLLLIGLATSWLAILPFVYQVVAMFAHPIIAYIVGALVCLAISLLCDKPLGIFVPQFCDKLLALFRGAQTSATAIFKLLALLGLSIALGALTMYLSSTGGTLTSRMLFENDRPKQDGFTVVKNDSIKQARIAAINKTFATELSDAKAKDDEITAKVNAALTTALKEADKAYKNRKHNQWESDQYKKAVELANDNHRNKMADAFHTGLVQNKINARVIETEDAFKTQKEIDEKNHRQAMADYERKVSVANALLRDLGYYSTPLFFVVVLISVLMGLGDAPAAANTNANTNTNAGSNPRPFAVITKHLTTYLTRLAEAVNNDNTDAIRTNAKNILAIYDEAECHHSAEFAAMQKRHRIAYPITDRSEIEKFANY